MTKQERTVLWIKSQHNGVYAGRQYDSERVSMSIGNCPDFIQHIQIDADGHCFEFIAFDCLYARAEYLDPPAGWEPEEETK